MPFPKLHELVVVGIINLINIAQDFCFMVVEIFSVLSLWCEEILLRDGTLTWRRQNFLAEFLSQLSFNKDFPEPYFS